MHETEQKIIAAFKREPGDLSTSQILDKINSSYPTLKAQLLTGSKENIEKTKQEIAKIHRRSLHHINKGD